MLIIAAYRLHYWEYVALEEAELQKKEAELQKSEISEAGLCSQFGQVALVDEEKATSKDKENNPDQITNSGKEDSVSYKTPARSYSPPDRVYNNNCYSSSSSSDRHFSTPTKSYNTSLETPSSLTPEEKDARTKERILQISNFPFSFKRNDFYEVFTTCKNVIFSRHGIALVVFPTKSLARVAYTKALSLPVLEEFEIAPFTGELPYELKAYAGRGIL